MIIIDGDDEERAITPAVWEAFADWYGDKAYRKADFVEELELKVREAVVNDLRRAARAANPVGHHPMSGVLTYVQAAEIAMGESVA